MGIVLGARTLIFLFIMTSRLVGRACGFQLKYTTRLGSRRRPTAFARFTTQMTGETYTALSTKTLIAGFVAGGPPVRAEEVPRNIQPSLKIKVNLQEFICSNVEY